MGLSGEEVAAAAVVERQVPPIPARRTKFLEQHTAKVPPIPVERTEVPPIPAKRTKVPPIPVEKTHVPTSDMVISSGVLEVLLEEDFNDGGDDAQFNDFDWEAFIDSTQLDSNSHKLGGDKVLDTQRNDDDYSHKLGGDSVWHSIG